MFDQIGKSLMIFAFLLIPNICCEKKENFRSGTRFRSIKCESNTSIVIIKYCYLKPVSRQVVTLNIGGKILFPINKPVYGQVTVNYRYGTIYRQVLDTHPIEWCEQMDGTNAHPLLSLIIEISKESAQELYHKCPYFGDVDVMNATIDRSKNLGKATMFPEGTYLGELIFIKDSIQIFKMTLSFEIKSALKESFG